MSRYHKYHPNRYFNRYKWGKMLWQQFERSKRAEGLKDKTLREYYRDCEAFATWAEHTYGQRFKADKPMLDHYMTDLSKTDLSAHRRYNILTALKSFYDWCENEGIRDNPARKIKYPKLPSKTVDTYQQSEIDRVLPLLSTRDALMVRLFLGTGLRAMEMQELEVRDIQLDQRQIHIRKAKMDKEGFVPIPDDLMHDIAHHIARKAPKDKLIGVCKDRMWHIWDNACKKAGVIPRGLHVMRHTWACDMLLAGISAYDLMHLGRWTDMKMVERYAANVSTQVAINNYHNRKPLR